MIKTLPILIFLLFLSSCQEETEPKNMEPTTCGCGGPTEFTVPSDIFPDVPFDVQTSGVIFFKDEDITARQVPTNREQKFWILQTVPGCITCRRVFFVCDEELLTGKFDFLKAPGNNDSIPISFEGDLMIPCLEDALFVGRADDFFRDIEVKLISKSK